jgi:hypothetical protein
MRFRWNQWRSSQSSLSGYLISTPILPFQKKKNRQLVQIFFLNRGSIFWPRKLTRGKKNVGCTWNEERVEIEIRCKERKMHCVKWEWQVFWKTLKKIEWQEYIFCFWTCWLLKNGISKALLRSWISNINKVIDHNPSELIQNKLWTACVYQCRLLKHIH